MNLRQALIEFGDLFYYQKLGHELRGMTSVLDLGCGSWSPLQKIKKTFFSVGIDIYPPAIENSKKQKTHDQYKKMDVLQVNKFFKKKSFDAVVALDLIEHLKKEDSLKLLKEMEKIAKEKIIILTPNGFTKQDPYEDNLYQIHQSGWTTNEFKQLGYKVYGMRGLKFIRGEYATIKYKPWFLWGALATLSQPITYFFPQLAYQLLAIKELKR